MLPALALCRALPARKKQSREGGLQGESALARSHTLRGKELESFRAELERLGEEEVRDRLARFIWGTSDTSWQWGQAKEVLARIERQTKDREWSIERKEDARQTTALNAQASEAKEANWIASKALTHAHVANVIAVGAFLVAVIALLFALDVL